MPQSAELAGGEGFTFEGDAAAYYLSALLAEAYAPGIEDRHVVRVSVQQRALGEPLDDVIVDFEASSGDPARLSLQVKRALTISNAQTNTEFREIIRDSWATLKTSHFRIGTDRYGAAVGSVAVGKERALKTLCDWARESLTAGHFEARFGEHGSASADVQGVKYDVSALLNEARGTPCTSEEVHQFLAHFVLIQFDFLREGDTDPPDAINRIRDCLAPNDGVKAPLIWSRAVQLARASAGKAGQFDRARLVRLISPVARLRGAPSLRLDIDRLTELASSYANLIPDDIGGVELDRSPLLEELETKLVGARVVQVRGLPGSGKSVVVKQAVQRALAIGPVLFLKAEQLEGTSWISYATSQGLSGARLEQLLVDVGASGTPVFFIDAIDRIEKEHQAVVLDVMRAIVTSPLLDNWKVVVSLRDTGIEVLRNWLSELLDVVKVETVSVEPLTDEEAETLARAKPHLRPLLFGSAQVREIVRRPFFAKVLNQSYLADPNSPTFVPQSEVDLLENWWGRGGYNETGQGAYERRRALLHLARLQAGRIGQPINLSDLSSVARIEDLRADGILQHARQGISIRFAHDIFFEWAYFHVLAVRGADWLDEIRASGEPPAVARVVELASQWEYVNGAGWRAQLAQTEASDLRSQWLRAWLVGPFGTAKFEADEDQFATAAFADDFRLFRKALVWFQAVKTSPNAGILVGPLPEEQRQRWADLFGVPTDFRAWRRLIDFILRRISAVPERLFPEVVAIFEVWQNALAQVPNATSRALLQHCAAWLASNPPDDSSAYTKKGSGLAAVRSSVAQLLLRSAKAEPSLAAAYLQRITALEKIPSDVFHDAIAYTPLLPQSLARPMGDLTLKFLREELPNEQVAREEQELRRATEWRKEVEAKPKAKRTRQEKMALSGGLFLRSVGDFSDHDWSTLSIHDDHRCFWPPSPLREPFRSLFRSAPEEALRLLRALCNHAMTAWRQLHHYSNGRGSTPGTPIPVELRFPWGTRTFWGTDREYMWFRSTWAPNAIGSGFMALEEWCFSELDRGRAVDELIQQVTDGNECIAILGVAAVLALHSGSVSEATLALITSQRLLTADHYRLRQDFQSAANLIGFSLPKDTLHFEAVQAANARPVRRAQLRQLVPGFVLAEEPIGEAARAALLAFKDDLPYQYEEEREVPQTREDLAALALEYSELADPRSYRARRTEDDSDQIAITPVSPSAAGPDNAARVEETTQRLREMRLWSWARSTLEESTLGVAHTVETAVAVARELIASSSLEQATSEEEASVLRFREDAVSATAAIVLMFREGCSHEHLEWARDVLGHARRLPKGTNLNSWSGAPVALSGLPTPWHQATYMALGLGADLRAGTAPRGAPADLLQLIAHPLAWVSLAALEEAGKLWSKEPKLAWAAMTLGLALCHVPRVRREHGHPFGEPVLSSDEAQGAVDEALAFYEKGSAWPPLPLPPAAWRKIEAGETGQHRRDVEVHAVGDTSGAAEVWVEPTVFWDSTRAAAVLKHLPLGGILKSERRAALLDFLAGVLDWTNQKNEPPWARPGRGDERRSRIRDWTDALGSMLGRVAGLVPLRDFQPRLLGPILGLQGDSCWALLDSFTHTYICVYVYDAAVVPMDAVATLELCLGRLLADPAFKLDAYRRGELSDFRQSRLARALMFVSVERAELAARYVNGDWSSISHILPVVDRFIRAGGWAAAVMDPFLTLCERARNDYPAEAFGDQVLSILGGGPDDLEGWRGTFIPARIAELVQHFAHRDAPMRLTVAQKFLRILDMLVDMGDRRSAALQLGEAFREIRLPS